MTPKCSPQPKWITSNLYERVTPYDVVMSNHFYFVMPSYKSHSTFTTWQSLFIWFIPDSNIPVESECFLINQIHKHILINLNTCIFYFLKILCLITHYIINIISYITTYISFIFKCTSHSFQNSFKSSLHLHKHSTLNSITFQNKLSQDMWVI